MPPGRPLHPQSSEQGPLLSMLQPQCLSPPQGSPQCPAGGTEPPLEEPLPAVRRALPYTWISSCPVPSAVFYLLSEAEPTVCERGGARWPFLSLRMPLAGGRAAACPPLPSPLQPPELVVGTAAHPCRVLQGTGPRPSLVSTLSPSAGAYALLRATVGGKRENRGRAGHRCVSLEQDRQCAQHSLPSQRGAGVMGCGGALRGSLASFVCHRQGW